MNFAWNARLPRSIQESLTCRKSTTWDRRLYFPSEGRRAEDFFALKNPTASAGFEPANLGTKGQHATSRPPLDSQIKFILIFTYITEWILPSGDKYCTFYKLGTKVTQARISPSVNFCVEKFYCAVRLYCGVLNLYVMKTWRSGVTTPCSLSFCCWWRGSSTLRLRRLDPANYWRKDFVRWVVLTKFRDSIWSIVPRCGRCWHCPLYEAFFRYTTLRELASLPFSATWLPIEFTDNTWWYIWKRWESNRELYWLYVYTSKNN